MSFSSDLKKELGKINNLTDKEQLKYELIGYLLSSNISIAKNKKIKYSTESQYNINRFAKLLSNLNIDYDIEYTGKCFVIESKTQEIEKYVITNNQKIKNDILSAKPENKKALIRGVFLGSGSVNNPSNKYHLEISLNDEEGLLFTQKILEEFEIETKQMESKDRIYLYIKEGEAISNILALIGASNAVMKFEDIRIEKEMRSKINRLVNCKSANLNKTLNAAVEQIEAIEKLKREKKFNKLNDNLKEIANLRLENPEMSLTELGQKLTIPLGKSGVNYRLKKIIEIANE